MKGVNFLLSRIVLQSIFIFFLLFFTEASQKLRLLNRNSPGAFAKFVFDTDGMTSSTSFFDFSQTLKPMGVVDS